MKKDSFSRQPCVSLKMINDVVVLPCIRGLENSLLLAALVTSPLCCSCSPKHQGDELCAPGGTGRVPNPGLGTARTCPLSLHRALCGTGLQAAPLPALLGCFLSPPSPRHSPSCPLWVAAAVPLSVPRCHSRAPGSHLMHRVVFGVSQGEKFPLSHGSVGSLTRDPEPELRVRSSAGNGTGGFGPAQLHPADTRLNKD